jgi:hypothetical protein
MMQHSTKIQSIPIYGQNDNIQEWGEFSRDDIKGEYIVEVFVGSTMPRRSYDNQQMYVGLLQGLAPFAQMPGPMGGPMINFQALIKGLLQAYPDIKNVDEILTPPPPPPMMQDPAMMATMQQGAAPEQPPQGGPPV